MIMYLEQEPRDQVIEENKRPKKRLRNENNWARNVKKLNQLTWNRLKLWNQAVETSASLSVQKKSTWRIEIFFLGKKPCLIYLTLFTLSFNIDKFTNSYESFLTVHYANYKLNVSWSTSVTEKKFYLLLQTIMFAIFSNVKIITLLYSWVLVCEFYICT